MRLRSRRLSLSVCAWGALLVGCAGGGSSTSGPVAAVPAAASRAAGNHFPAAVRRAAYTAPPSCSGTGTGSFLGINNANVSDALDSVVVGGDSDEVCDEYSSVVGGVGNQISSGSDTADHAFIGGGYFNVITGKAEEAVIGGGHNNAINGTSTNASFIGAGFNNTITGAAEWGGILAGENNTVTGIAGSVSGGNQNQNAATNGMLGAGESNTIGATAQDAFLGAGSTNTVSAEYGVVVGGLQNNVSGEGGYIAAGGYNTVSGEGGVIDGGFNSTVSGTFATIPGGYVNSAAGTYSFAAGARASAPYTGDFVWSDGSDGDTILTATKAYQFLARASGGFTLYTNAASTVGAQLAAGSGTWASLSDRNVKTNIVPLDDAAVLQKVAGLPISRWSYRTEHGVRHVGPMAQDFYAAFKVGEDDKHITSIDEDGVALAAIKALHADNKALHAENALLRAELAALRTSTERDLRRLNATVAALQR